MDEEGKEQLGRLFDDFLAFMEKIEEESAKRLAESGEEPITMLIGTDRETGTIAIVPLDEPPDEKESSSA